MNSNYSKSKPDQKNFKIYVNSIDYYHVIVQKSPGHTQIDTKKIQKYD